MIPPDIVHKNRDDVSVLRLLDPLMIPPDVFHKNRSLGPLMIPPDVFHKNRTVSVLRSVDPLSNSSWCIPHETLRCVSSSFHRPTTIQLPRCRQSPPVRITWPAAIRSLTLLVTVFAATGTMRILQYSEIALAVGCWCDGYCLE